MAEKHIGIQYLNKPYLVQLKRVLRAVKRIPEPEKVRKAGIFMQAVRPVSGPANINEKIVKDIFGTKMEMSPQDFIKKIYEYEVPLGNKMYVRKETAMQEVQRLMPNKQKNKTISVSVFGNIYDEITKKYEAIPEAEDYIRAINRNLNSHFSNAANFVRWTEVSPRWIHIDAFQTDFFNELKAMLFHEKERGEKDSILTKIIEDFRKHEVDFFKTAVSYIQRTNPNVKIWTANTMDMVAKAEGIRGDVKLRELYYQLPEKLGFRLIPVEKLYKILGTRPGPEMTKAHKLFSGALERINGEVKTDDTGDLDTAILRTISSIRKAKTLIKTRHTKATELSQEIVQSAITNSTNNDAVKVALHQFLQQITEEAKKPKSSLTALFNKIKPELTKFIQENAKKGTGQNVWWANRQMLFENTKYDNRMIIESFRSLAGL